MDEFNNGANVQNVADTVSVDNNGPVEMQLTTSRANVAKAAGIGTAVVAVGVAVGAGIVKGAKWVGGKIKKAFDKKKEEKDKDKKAKEGKVDGTKPGQPVEG